MTDRHLFDSTILREYDVRGIVGQTLGEADARALGRALGTRIRRDGGSTVAVGYDGRLSSPALEAALVDGLVATGLTVKRVGLGPTPMLYYAVFELDADGGVMVTGSHNPPDYNGFKMMVGKQACYGRDIQALGAAAAAGDFDDGEGGVEQVDIFDRYVDRLLRDFDGAPLKVAWDAGNGAAGQAVERVASRLPGEHVTLNTDIDGTFPAHHPDPTVEANLAQLKDVVRERGLDLGLAFDGDGDRIGAIDGQGRVIWGDQILAILARDVLAVVPGAAIIADVKASQSLFDEIGRLGGQPVMWRTGHSLIKTKMLEMAAPLAGEMSGHIFFKHKFYGFDDAVYAAIRLLNAVSHQGGDLAALRDGLPHAVNTPEIRFDCPDDRKAAVVEEVKARLEGNGAEVNTVDGVRVSTPDGWWLLRASNTQPVLVARCEGPDAAALERLKAGLAEQLNASGVRLPAGF